MFVFKKAELAGKCVCENREKRKKIAYTGLKSFYSKPEKEIEIII